MMPTARIMRPVRKR